MVPGLGAKLQSNLSVSATLLQIGTKFRADWGAFYKKLGQLLLGYIPVCKELFSRLKLFNA